MKLKHRQNNFHAILDANLTVQHVFQINQKWKNNKCQCECKKYRTCKRDQSQNPGTCICKNSSYLKSILDDSVILFEESIGVTNSVSTNVANAVPTNVNRITNVKSTVSINSGDNKKQ